MKFGLWGDFGRKRQNFKFQLNRTYGFRVMTRPFFAISAKMAASARTRMAISQEPLDQKFYISSFLILFRKYVGAFFAAKIFAILICQQGQIQGQSTDQKVIQLLIAPT